MINNDEALDIAEDYILTYVGNLVGCGIPFFDNERTVWVVPILHMSDVATFPLDEMHIDADGDVVYCPTREKLIEIAEKRFEWSDEIKKFTEAISR